VSHLVDLDEKIRFGLYNFFPISSPSSPFSVFKVRNKYDTILYAIIVCFDWQDIPGKMFQELMLCKHRKKTHFTTATPHFGTKM
jgi:hypothetical protein